MNSLLEKISTWFTTLTDSPNGPLPALLGAFAIGAGLFLLFAWRLNRRVKSFDERLEDVENSIEEEPTSRGVFDFIAPALAVSMPESSKNKHEFRNLLRGAGLYHPNAAAHINAMRFVFLVMPLFAAGAMAMQAERSEMTPILIGGAAIAGVLSITPRLYVFFRRRARTRAIRHGLPDAMDMLSMCVGGGMALSPSLDHVARQLKSHPELAEELLILKRQAEVGSLKMALSDFAARVDLPEVRQLAGLLTRGEQLGTKLAGSLVEHSDHLRQARKQLATMQANKTPVKLVLPLMFCFAPAALILLIGPAMIELKEFVAPTNGSSVLSNNSRIGITPVVSSIRGLEQDVTAAR